MVDYSSWKSFVYNHPNGNIFQTPEMYEVYSKTKNYEPILVTIDDKNILYGLVLGVIQKEKYFKNFTSRSVIIGGPLVKDNDPIVLNDLLIKYNAVIKKKAIYSQIRNIFDTSSQREVFHINGYAYDDHLDIIHDLTKSEEAQWLKISRDKKKCIKNANRNLLVINITDEIKNINEIYFILKNVYNRIKLPLPDISFFENAIEILKKERNINIFGAYLNDQLIGVRIVLCYKNLIYDWYAGSDNKYLKYRPNDILPWEVMKWGSQNGYEIFDFGGAGKPNVPYGVRDYKLRFGGFLVNYGRYEAIHQTMKMSFAKTAFKLYQYIKNIY